MTSKTQISMREVRKYGIRRTIFSFWDAEKGTIAEVEYNHKSKTWSCGKCRSADCEHVLQARVWKNRRMKQQEELWRRMESLYPAEPARPHIKFAPCPD